MDENQRSPTIVYDDEDAWVPEPEPEPGPPFWADGRRRIGIHTSVAGDFVSALEKAAAMGCTALQIFSASPRAWAVDAGSRQRFAPAEVERFRARRRELRLGPLAIHDNYLINLAAADRVVRVRSVQAFHDELVRAVALGAEYLVAHPGSAGGAPVEEAIARVAEGLRQAVRGIRLGGLTILLEGTAGQGTSIGWRFEQLAGILARARELPVGVCVDTAHLLAAGYDIRTAEGLEATLEALHRTVGLDRLHVVHANDSKVPLGARSDRHEHIGKGKIGMEAFRRILNHPLLAAKAFIAETPIERPGDDARNVRVLWSLVGVKVKQAKGATGGFKPRKKKDGGKGSKGGRGSKGSKRGKGKQKKR